MNSWQHAVLRGSRILLLVATVVTTVLISSRQQAVADDSTSTPTAIPTAVATSTPIATDTPVPVATRLPTVKQEKSTPIATSAPFVASTPEPSVTPTFTALPEATKVPTALPTVPPLLAPTASNSGSAVWPSPAQLEQDARLRWGARVPSTVRRWAFLIVPAAREYNLDPNLVAAVMTMESNGDPLALSPADARGLMQVLHGPWDPRTNVFLGVSMLAHLYAEFGDWTLALAAYNAGEGAVQEYGGVPPYRETRDYVIVVRYLWDLYSHHKLTASRRSLFRSTLKDLTHFKGQSKKVAPLARIAHLPVVPSDPCGLTACQAAVAPSPASDVLDPFWPDSTTPDPLQRVDPFPAGGQ